MIKKCFSINSSKTKNKNFKINDEIIAQDKKENNDF
jgi:hypothetical protein